LLLPMIALTALGVALLVGAPLVARLAKGRGSDHVGLTRILQAAGVVLLIGALLLRPRNLETTAVPPPPDAQTSGEP
jgi:hypothetical protein